MLSASDQQQLSRLHSGHEGELLFFSLVKEYLGPDAPALFDLTFQVNGSVCQIDCLLFFQTKLFLFEVKNFSGDYFVEADHWYTLHRKEINNPLHQLKRTTLLLQQFLNNHKMQIPIQPYVVFTHPAFHLYDAQRNLPIIYPAQLHRFFKTLENLPRNMRRDYERFGNRLRGDQALVPSFDQPLHYHFTDLKKGILCAECSRQLERSNVSSMICSVCHTTEPLEKSIIRSIEEYLILFPHEKLTVKAVAEWVDYQVSNNFIRKILATGWKMVKKSQYTHYLPFH